MRITNIVQQRFKGLSTKTLPRLVQNKKDIKPKYEVDYYARVHK